MPLIWPATIIDAVKVPAASSPLRGIAAADRIAQELADDGGHLEHGLGLQQRIVPLGGALLRSSSWLITDLASWPGCRPSSSR
jgi:hypothetical protein